MKSKTYSKIDDFGESLGLSGDEITIAKLKTKLRNRIITAVNKDENLNPTELAKISELSRSVVSGVINGSLQSVSLERLSEVLSALNIPSIKWMLKIPASQSRLTI